MPKVSAPRTYTLRRASFVVFALVSVLPLLLFAYTLHALNVLNEYLAQIALGSALALAAVGFYIYSVMISRLSDILRNLEIDEAQPSAAGAPPGPVVTMAVEPTPGSPMSAAHGAVSRFAAAQSLERPAPRPAKPRPASAARGPLVVPGVGRIMEIKPEYSVAALSDLDLMWRAEAEPLVGKRVLVAVRNTAEPIKGVLSQVTEDGVILDQSGSTFGISYTRVSAIEADTAPEPV